MRMPKTILPQLGKQMMLKLFRCAWPANGSRGYLLQTAQKFLSRSNQGSEKSEDQKLSVTALKKQGMTLKLVHYVPRCGARSHFQYCPRSIAPSSPLSMRSLKLFVITSN